VSRAWHSPAAWSTCVPSTAPILADPRDRRHRPGGARP
jgi:hypothetical protein